MGNVKLGRFEMPILVSVPVTRGQLFELLILLEYASC